MVAIRKHYISCGVIQHLRIEKLRTPKSAGEVDIIGMRSGQFLLEQYLFHLQSHSHSRLPPYTTLLAHCCQNPHTHHSPIITTTISFTLTLATSTAHDTACTLLPKLTHATHLHTGASRLQSHSLAGVVGRYHCNCDDDQPSDKLVCEFEQHAVTWRSGHSMISAVNY